MRNSSSRWLLLAAGVLAPSVANGQEAVLSRYETNVAGDRFFSVLGSNVDGHLVPRGLITFDYQHRPFVLTDGNGNEIATPSRARALVHASASLSIAKRVLVSVDAPFAVYQAGDTVAFGATQELTATNGASMGEVRFGVRGRILGRTNDPFQLSAGGFVYLPTAQDAWGGEGYVYGQPTVQASGLIGRVRYGANVGVKIRGSEDATSLTYAAGAGMAFLDDKLFVGPEVFGSYDVAKPVPIAGVLDLSSSGSSAEALLGGQYRFLQHFVAGAAAGAGLTSAIGSPEFRGLVRFAYSPLSSDEETAAKPVDTDKDGIFDPKDACPNKAGVASDNPKKNGCPIADKDKDSIADEDDACVDVAGVATDDPKTNGCPPDRDEDGVFDADDGCPDEAGSKNAKGKDKGCPDKDGDTIADRSDACVDEFGFPNRDAKRHGCPRAVMTQKEIVINQRIEFEVDKWAILPDSLPIVDAVAKILTDNADILLLEVDGHADEMGEPMKNMVLSQKRAESVMAALVERGIAKNRIRARGFGSSKPLDTAKTDEALQRNRRVEFIIITRKPVAGAPAAPRN